MANNLGFVWMFLLDASVLNWLEYQYNKEIEMDKNTNSFVWMLMELGYRIAVSFQYQIMFGRRTMELHGGLCFMYQIKIYTTCGIIE